MNNFVETIILNFFVAFGVMIGGCLIGGLGAFLVGQPPLNWAYKLAGNLKIWALVAAIGGTFETISAIERGFMGGVPEDIIKQLIYIFFAFLGAHSGSQLVLWTIGEI